MKVYIVYILKCSDNSYYTGITSNLDKRLIEHENTSYRSFVSKRRPFKLVYSKTFTNPMEAIKIEKQVKKWSRKKKVALINSDIKLLKQLSRSRNQSWIRQAHHDS